MFTIKKGFGLALAGVAALTIQGTATASAATVPAATVDPKAGCIEPAETSTAKSSVWQAFARFGDIADYFLAPGGDFETGAKGWNLSNAAVVRGNESFGITRGSQSLQLGSGLLSVATAVSPAFCVTDAHPTFRFVARPRGLVGVLSTFVRYQAVDGTTREEQVHSRSRLTLLPGFWSPSELQPLATKVPMAKVGGVASVRLVFRAPINVVGAGYQIDSLLVDPYRSR
ncbi:MAG: hypothetical protein Q7T55_11070 [Solirubrobacteraceae bacterium]|nr:hypothetical protein [Solirubrobacteraceae bacterium]